jgi:nucleoside-diphosphate-sugar epimerase
MTETAAVIGGAGNVGAGIVKALRKKQWKCRVIDPKVNKKVEELSAKEFEKIFKPKNTIIYAADEGNRDIYVAIQNLGKQNNERFAKFCSKLSKVNSDAVIWYVGGSWTKRKPSAKWLVDDNSPNKPIAEYNAYEKAKISAEKSTENLSQAFKIRFIDWISIVPNLAENFSIPVMVRRAIKEGTIAYSPGPFGRPLLETTDAGKALIKLIENDDKNEDFKKYLIPGIFTKFELFAKAAKSAVEKDSKRKISLVKIKNTPVFLKTKVESNNLKSLGFKPDRKALLAALEKNAESYLKLISS